MSDILSAADITRILANGRNRGGNENFLKGFLASDEMYAVVNEHPNYSGKTKEQMVSIKNALTTKAKSLDMTNVRLVKNDDLILVVNTDKIVTEVEDETEA